MIKDFLKANRFKRARGRCPRGWTADARGKCRKKSRFDKGRGFGSVRHRGRHRRNAEYLIERGGLINILRCAAEEMRTAIMKPCREKDIDPDRPKSEQKWCLYSKKDPDKLLGRHPSQQSAKDQEVAIHSHGG